MLTRAEIAERRRHREEGKSIPKRKKKKRKKLPKPMPGRRTIVATCSISPEMKIRAMRDLGDGSFTKAVVRTLRNALSMLDHGRTFDDIKTKD